MLTVQSSFSYGKVSLTACRHPKNDINTHESLEDTFKIPATQSLLPDNEMANNVVFFVDDRTIRHIYRPRLVRGSRHLNTPIGLVSKLIYKIKLFTDNITFLFYVL